MQEKIQILILTHLKNSAKDYKIAEFENANLDTLLYNGSDGNLDSLGLIILIADLEELINKEFSKEIVLANERVMSMKNSPFKDVKSLSTYIHEKIEETKE